MSRRLRLILIVCGSLVLAALLALLIVVYLVLQPDRFTAMLQAQARNVGLELHLAQPASPSLFPSPALDLHGITLNAQRATSPILLAARGRLALPWRTLLGGPTVISQLQIDAPRVDLDALQAWLDELPPSEPDKAPNIPRIDAGISITRGTIVRGNQLLLGNVNLQAGHLVSGQPFPLKLSARTPSGTPLTLRLTSTPRIDGNALQLNNIALHLEQAGNLALVLNGSARWHGAADTTASLAGKLDYADAGQYDLSLQLKPALAQKPALLRMTLDGPGDHGEVQLRPQALMDWWGAISSQQDPRLSVPPVSAKVEMAKLQAGNVSIKGLSIIATDEVPASATTTGKPAPAATTAAATSGTDAKKASSKGRR